MSLCWSLSLLCCVTLCWRANVAHIQKCKSFYRFIFSFELLQVEVIGAFMDDISFPSLIFNCVTGIKKNYDPALICFFPLMISCLCKRTRLGLPIMRKSGQSLDYLQESLLPKCTEQLQKKEFYSRKKVSKGNLLYLIDFLFSCMESLKYL